MYSFDAMEDMMHSFEDTWADYDWEEFYEEPENPDSAKPDFKPIPGNGTCGFPTNTGFIVGGENTVRGEIPFLAALGKF